MNSHKWKYIKSLRGFKEKKNVGKNNIFYKTSSIQRQRKDIEG